MAVTTPTREAPPGADRIRARVPPLLARLSTQRPRRRVAGYAVALLGTVALTLSFLPVRNDITPLSKGFGFLAVVVVAAAVGGLGPGILASFLGFLAFNFFFIPPYGTFVIARAEDVVVLFVFLGLCRYAKRGACNSVRRPSGPAVLRSRVPTMVRSSSG